MALHTYTSIAGKNLFLINKNTLAMNEEDKLLRQKCYDREVFQYTKPETSVL